VDEGATDKEEVHRRSGPKKKCLPNEEQQQKRKKAKDNAYLDEHGKRITKQLLSDSILQRTTEK
jgi:hypothetical protein